jgi:hypothetical protein
VVVGLLVAVAASGVAVVAAAVVADVDARFAYTAERKYSS